MQKRFSRGWLIACMFACINAYPVAEKKGDESYDIEDFSAEKFIENMDEGSIELPELNGVSSTTPKNQYVILPQGLEPDAEMLPAHYTGVKPPGVDHMEITFLDSASQGSNLKDNLADGTKSNGYSSGGGSAVASAKSSSGGVKGEKGVQRKASFEKGIKDEKLKENRKGEYSEAAGKKRAHQETDKHFKGQKDERAGQRSESFEVEGHREKGHNAAGYHNVYHKDEYKKDADFYDNDHKGGRFHKHGHYDEKHVAAEGDFRKGGSHNSGFAEAEAGKRGNFEKGRATEEAKGHAAKSGYDAFFGNLDEFEKRAGGAASLSFNKNKVAPAKER